ncbi:hypothetical protein KY290_022288 [Solanum tuberosum]|uniref:non-specific serine/threonine protein kinase n=1 Tax=Solanum tuberosum TaxID=4113 RepID=A0ABQ7V3Y1_SOLTU|nr:hypothetical protein KY290_022288 [Solanum tuberosum]
MAKGRKLILITVLPVMGALILLCVFVVVWFMCDKRKRVRDVERWDDGWLSITMLDGKALYRDILNAIEEFDAKFCIGHGGHGSVYKIDLPSLGNIALKRLHYSFQNTHPKSFMNEDSSPPIVHRDISSSNVLLDSEYEARVADFGIAKIPKPDSTNRTALAGTYGYVAPDKF